MTSEDIKYDLQAVCARFNVPGTFTDVLPLTKGLINDTFRMGYEQEGSTEYYTVQRINHNVFKDPPALQENYSRVTGHIRSKLEAAGADQIERRVINLLPANDGKYYYRDSDDNYWRIYRYIGNARTYDTISNLDQAFQAARAFGNFQRHLADLPGPRLNETIPAFHDTRSRFNVFLKAVKEDPANRAASVKDEIGEALASEKIVDTLLDLNKEGVIPERITHNDTKLNNVLIDDKTGEGICVIDLDTVMPGLSLYDVGDMIRSATNPAREDEKDLSKVVMRMDVFEALARGYLESAGSMLRDREKELLGFSGRLITIEVGLRFLTDYLQGDIYFKTRHEHHNLDRSRVQFALARSLAEHEDRMRRIVKGIN